MSNKTYKLSDKYSLDNVKHSAVLKDDSRYAFLKIYETDPSIHKGLWRHDSTCLQHKDFTPGIYISKTNIQIASYFSFETIVFEELK
jgi:hypothetical protein